MPVDPQNINHVFAEQRMVMMRLLTAKEGDLKLVCGTKIVRAHSFLLKPRSTFFAARCEAGFSDPTDKCIELPDDFMPSVARMVDYCYLMDYSDGPVLEHGGSPEPSYVSRAHTNAQVYALADKYDIVGLLILAIMKFDVTMEAEFASAPVRPDMAHLIAIISLVYNSTPDSNRVLRDRVINYVWKHWKELSPKPEFVELIAANPELMIGFVNEKFGQQLAMTAGL